ncbi:hypothetical protein B0T17DRAFT_612955 [Bombardia bombarda]|uniref:Uncharacterized protein n=1 Tax=Bombardia bombarda TaxID=252184 RepID=A0AA39XLE9_9PEZI|nr:hypothetical protein B0T17DRAFT_612955 [Bombardia bombarda]
MGPPRLSLRRSLVLTIFSASLLLTGALGQNDDDADTSTSSRTSASTSSASSSRSTSSSSSRSTSSSSTGARSTSSSTSASAPARTTAVITGTVTNSVAPSFTGLPTLSKTVNTFVPDYPAPSVPPTHNAPYMNHSTLPEGTVFICVGAVLGAFAIAVLAWRSTVAWLLHRSVERATLRQHRANEKAANAFGAPGAGGGSGGGPAPFYKYNDRDSSPSLLPPGAATPGGRSASGGGISNNNSNGNNLKKNHRLSTAAGAGGGPGAPSATPSQTNLFFSPTAQPGANASHRESRFLPSGFYASAGGPAPAGAGHGYSHSHGGNGNSISMTNLRPASVGFASNGSSAGPLVVPSPDGSPELGPRTTMHLRNNNFSSSSVNLNNSSSSRPASGRAPSAFLDDLLDHEQITPGSAQQQYPYGGPLGGQQQGGRPF